MIDLIQTLALEFGEKSHEHGVLRSRAHESMTNISSNSDCPLTARIAYSRRTFSRDRRKSRTFVRACRAPCSQRLTVAMPNAPVRWCNSAPASRHRRKSSAL